MNNAFSRIAGFYDGLVDRYGHSPQACDYGHAQSQAIKFEVLSQVLPLKGKSVLDVGCGFADYADYLSSNCGVTEYAGIDVSPRMIEEARRLRPALDLRLGNILEDDVSGTFDVVNANGIFYLLGDEVSDLMPRLIRRMYELAKVAVAFNSLSSWTTTQEPNEFYADPIETVKFCQTLTPWLVLRHDYHPRDFTIYLYKERRS